jgi:hypothetical protein
MPSTKTSTLTADIEKRRRSEDSASKSDMCLRTLDPRQLSIWHRYSSTIEQHRAQHNSAVDSLRYLVSIHVLVVVWFLVPWFPICNSCFQDLMRFHDRKKFEIHVYATTGPDDPTFLEKGMRGVSWRQKVTHHAHTPCIVICYYVFSWWGMFGSMPLSFGVFYRRVYY